jgi:hypothetical protein
MTNKYKNKTYESYYHDRLNVSEEFVSKNNLSLARSPQEILKRMHSINDILGFERSVLAGFLPFEEIKTVASEEYIQKIESKEEIFYYVSDIYEAVQDFLDYMVFAWMKALDERGISASRSISKLSAWLWLFGRDDLYDLIHNENLYNPYGMPALIEVCKALGIECPKDCLAFAGVKCND